MSSGKPPLVASAIAIHLTLITSIGAAQPAPPLANAAATSPSAPGVEILRERLARDPNRQSVGLRIGTARATMSFVVDPSATIAQESIPEAPDLVALRVDDGRETRFVVFATRPRISELAILGPVASDEDHPVSLGSRTNAGAIELAIVVRSGDRCGMHEARLDTHRIDAAHRTATRVARIDAAPSPGTSTTATTVGTEPAGFVAIDTAITTGGRISAGLDRLVDGDPSTRFPDSTGGARIHARYTLAPLRARAIRVSVHAGANRSRELVITVGEERFALTPETDAFELRFATPRDARCVSVELSGSGAASIGELAIVPDLDSDEARAEQLVVELASEGPRADAAIEALALLGAPSTAALSSAYADALPTERRRILRAAELLSNRDADALRLFVVALEGDDEGLRDYALDRCTQMGNRGLRVLSTAIRRGSSQLARAFAERAPFASLAPILERLTTAEDDERRALHDALIVAARRDEARVRPALRTYVETDADERARAIVLDVLRATGDAEGIAAALDLWWTNAPTTEQVEVQLRWVEAIAIVPPTARTPEMYSQLEAALANEAWMLRAAAVAALADDASRIAAVRARLDDEVPRVRVAAIRALEDDTESRRRIAELSRTDAWPIVRLAALAIVAPMSGSDALVRAALTERSTRVRIGLFAQLAAATDRRFVADAIGVIERGRAPANVLVAAIRYLEAVCATESEAVLVATVELELREDSEPHRLAATAAAHALERFGTPDGVSVARRFVDPTRNGGRAPARCDDSPIPATSIGP